MDRGTFTDPSKGKSGDPRFYEFYGQILPYRVNPLAPPSQLDVTSSNQQQGASSTGQKPSSDVGSKKGKKPSSDDRNKKGKKK